MFGGNIAFAAQVAAKNASAVVQQQTFADVKNQLTLLSQLAAAGRKRRQNAARAVSNAKKSDSDDKKKGNRGNSNGSKTRRFVQSIFKKIYNGERFCYLPLFLLMPLIKQLLLL